ncbi:nuclear transport factor 2 [Rhododendron vialii]|uniref:nuclear transport factor 2 n=1 Tax=Rhododendron vialii TaxID=182163 RepID=UPI00265E4A40|nr:nuclear transport factor 2 [Rhododendron vialii]
MEGRLRWRHDQRFIGGIFLSSCCWIRQMAMQAAFPSAALHGAQIVANAFVEQYYHILHQSPELVYKFYQDSSVLSRPNSNGVMTSVTAMQAINEKILSMEYRNYKAEIKTADAQDSYKEGVIVLVTGCLTGKEDSVRKKFTQTFFLAPQENGYYVLNDVFRYVDESQSLDFNSVSENGINDNTQLAPSMLDPESIRGPDQPSLEPVATIEAEDLNGAEVCDPSDHEEGSVIEEEIIDDPPAHSSSNEVDTVVSLDPAAAAAPGEKKSYASIVKVTKVVAKASTPVYVPTRSMRVAAANVDQQSLGSAKPPPELEVPAPSDSAPESIQEEAEGHSIYIRNLPLNASVVQLEEEFKKFGPIKHGGIQVRSNKGFCFGFVEFESLDAMQAAIGASTVTIGGRQTVIEEKRTTTRVGSSGRGRYPSGRGGFRNDGFRGRGNFGGGRGYGRSEFSGRPKGPSGRVGEGYQRIDQNGGGRGGRQGEGNKSVAAA